MMMLVPQSLIHYDNGNNYLVEDVPRRWPLQLDLGRSLASLLKP
jgi:hypothetical protein